ncbi:MAG: hypothetical protein IRZ33_01210 [Alicyclobacillaceae bacterium]|nr:hypothetical protein [Alicyclobacillaceae bacterium]
MERFFQNDTALRVLALVLACIIWLTVGVQGNAGAGGPAPTTIAEHFPFAVQVEVAPDMVASAVEPGRADVVVRVNSTGLTALPGEMAAVQVVANATGLGPGRHTVPLTVQNMPNASFAVQPKQVSVVLERKVTVAQPVHVVVTGEAAPGYMAASANVYPAVVRVSGAQSAVNRVAALRASLSVDRARRTITETVPVIAVDRDGLPVTGVEADPATVTVTVPVQPPQAQEALVPTVVGEPAAGFAVAGVSLQPDKVSLYGGAGPNGGIKIPVDVSGFRHDRTVVVQVPLPDGVVKADPRQVQAVVAIQPSAMRTLTGLPVSVRDAPPGRTVQVAQPVRATVVVSGPASAVHALRADDVVVFVDAFGLQPGLQAAPIDVQVPPWVKVVQLSASTARVRVR